MSLMKTQHWLMTLVAIAVLVTCTLAGCKKDGTDEPTPGDVTTFDRRALLNDITNNVILPGYATLNNTSVALRQAAEAFATAPDMDGLVALRAAWNTTMDAWMACEMFRYGLQYTENLNQRIAYVSVNTTLIENEISGSGPIDAAYIANAGVTRKGLYALEYLLYNGDDAALLDAFTTAPTAERRRTYTTSLCTDVAVRVAAVQDAWNGGYASAFIAATQSDISGSLNVLVNAWIEHIELVRRDKVQLPSGIEAGDVPNPAAVENRLSGRSIANIKLAVQQWQRIFDSAGGSGLDDNLDAINARYEGDALSARIRQEMQASLAACDAITLPLNEAVIGQQPEVNALFLALKRLTVLTKLDMASQLGVIITFSDNDGD